MTTATTIFYPDLSHYDRNRGLRLQAGTAAVIAKVTEGTGYADPAFTYWRDQAAHVGALFGAYHWLHHANLTEQARWCIRHAGDVPLMIDAEDTSSEPGYNGTLTVADLLGFAQAYRALGGTVHLAYLPHWYWADHMRSPDLRPLSPAGLGLISSSYTTYSDTGAGWRPYGGLTPVGWQYTDKHPYGGAACDFNAFKGSVAQFAALLRGRLDPPTGSTHPSIPSEMIMRDAVILRRHSDGALTVRMGAFGVGIEDMADLARWQTVMKAAGCAPEQYDVASGALDVPADCWDLAVGAPVPTAESVPAAPGASTVELDPAALGALSTAILGALPAAVRAAVVDSVNQVRLSVVPSPKL